MRLLFFSLVAFISSGFFTAEPADSRRLSDIGHKPPGEWLTIPGYGLARDMGARPSTDSADYAMYRIDDNASVVGTETAEVINDIPQAWRFAYAEGNQFLFPDTPYVRWALNAYARHIDHTSLEAAGVNKHDIWDYKALNLPSYLYPPFWSRDSVVHVAEADRNGHFVFTHLSARPYILYVGLTLRGPVVDVGSSTRLYEQITPNGLQTNVGSSGGNYEALSGEGWMCTVLVSGLKANTMTTLESNYLAPIATYVDKRSDFTW